MSVNAGVVHGGTRPNVVAEEATAIVDVRAPSFAEAERLDAIFRRLSPQVDGASLVVTGGFDRPPMERSEGVARLYGYAVEVAAALGEPIDEGGTGGGSDGNFTAASACRPSTGSGPLATVRTRCTSTSESTGSCRAPPCSPG